MIKVKTTTNDVTDALGELGLTVEQLHEAIKAGFVERSRCTANDAPFFPALLQWNHTQRGLREQLIPAGWSASDDGNYCTVVSPDNTIAIATASGCDNTGNPIFSPTTKSPKGPNTVDAVTSNAAQLLLPGVIQMPTVPKATDGKVTWLLLFYPAEQEIRAELSLPAAMGGNGKPDTWSVRIILPPLPLDPIMSIAAPDFGPDLDVEVVRRA